MCACGGLLLKLPLFYRNTVASVASVDSATVQPVAPEDDLKPFEPVTEPFDDSSQANCFTSKSSTKNTIGTDDLNVSGLNYSPSRPSVLLPSLASPVNVGIPKGDFASREAPQVFRGVRGFGTRTPSVSRLSVIDKKWLERCQVFGEMETEVKPGAGNQENIQIMQEAGADRIIVNKEKNGGRETENLERDEGLKSNSDKNAHDGPHKPSRQQPQEKVNYSREEVTETPPMPLSDTKDEHKLRKHGDHTQKKGRKRQREGENVDGEKSDEGGVKKKRRNAKKESSNVNLSPDQAGQKKRRVKKKEEGETKEEKDIKLAEKVSLCWCMRSCMIATKYLKNNP